MCGAKLLRRLCRFRLGVCLIRPLGARLDQFLLRRSALGYSLTIFACRLCLYCADLLVCLFGIGGGLFGFGSRYRGICLSVLSGLVGLPTAHVGAAHPGQ
ncbi:hypothetical protein OIO89_00780 (plasmid) [Mycobacterium ulcerans]|nr:hypothetical protein OIO89_00780 [Mycobacterium ulcerans]